MQNPQQNMLKAIIIDIKRQIESHQHLGETREAAVLNKYYRALSELDQSIDAKHDENQIIDADELAEISGESIKTLKSWFKNKPRRFDLILKGAIAEKSMQRNQ